MRERCILLSNKHWILKKTIFSRWLVHKYSTATFFEHDKKQEDLRLFTVKTLALKTLHNIIIGKAYASVKSLLFRMNILSLMITVDYGNDSRKASLLLIFTIIFISWKQFSCSSYFICIQTCEFARWNGVARKCKGAFEWIYERLLS